MKTIIQQLNLLMVKMEIRNLLSIKPFDSRYDIFCSRINEIKCKTLLEEIKNEGYVLKKQSIEREEINHIIGMTKSEILFRCNDIDYYGDRKIVYNVMSP